MKAYRKKDLYHLKAAINGFTNEARRIRAKEIEPKEHDEREEGWHRKRSIGLTSRFHQLAYAFMLGKKYSDLEKNRPLVENWWQTESAAETILLICKLYSGYYAFWFKDLNQDAIITWFKTDESIFKRPDPTRFTLKRNKMKQQPLFDSLKEKFVNLGKDKAV